MKIVKRLLLLAVLLLAAAIIYNYPKLNIISGYAAKNMASSIFVAGRSEEGINKDDNNVPMIKLADTEVDTGQKMASAAVFGLMHREAVFREGLGAVLINDDYAPTDAYLVPVRSYPNNETPFPYGNAEPMDSIFDNVNYKLLQNTLDSAFARPKVQKTRSVIVVYKDVIVAEKYAGGITKETPVLGWSMTKSILATLFGILEYQQKIDIAAYRPFASAEDPDSNNPKAEITLNHLLRMQSGLEWDEDYTSISDATKMLFLSTDMSRTQADKELIAAPTDAWNYSSGTSNYLSGVLRKLLADDQLYLNAPYSMLIDKIGMNSMVLESDLSGNYVLSSYGWANTRDWAKFGLLYLHKGQWQNERLFSRQWVDYVTTPTLHSDSIYGAHFWLNAGGKYPGAPRDLYSANGYQGQYVFIIPSKELVIVRTGLAETPEFEVNSFLEGVVNAIE